MKDLLLDDSGDLLLDKNGDIQFTDSIKQAIAIRLRWFANEWKLGPDFGIPYYEEAFIKNPSQTLLEERMREAIESVDEVDEIEDFSLRIDSKLRKLDVAFVVRAGGTTKEGRLTVNV